MSTSTRAATAGRALPCSVAQQILLAPPRGLVTGVAAAGLAIGLIRDESPAARTAAIIAALAAGAVLFRLTR